MGPFREDTSCDHVMAGCPDAVHLRTGHDKFVAVTACGFPTPVVSLTGLESRSRGAAARRSRLSRTSAL